MTGTKPMGQLCSAEAQAHSLVTTEPNANFDPQPWILCLCVLMTNCPHGQRQHYAVSHMRYRFLDVTWGLVMLAI